MEPAIPIRISASGVRAFRECAYRYALDYIRRLPDAEREPVSAFAFGNAVHKALAQFIRLGGWARKSSDDLIELLMRHWDSRAYADEDTSFAEFTRAREMLEIFHANPYPPVVTRELQVEAYVSWSTQHSGIIATGRLDRSCLLPDAVLEIVDYKTGRHMLTPAEMVKDVQAVFYRTLGADAYRGLQPAAIQVSYLYLESGKPVSVVFQHDEFLSCWNTVRTTIGEIRRSMRSHQSGAGLTQAFPPNRGDHCRMCPMRRHCDTMMPLPPIGQDSAHKGGL